MVVVDVGVDLAVFVFVIVSGIRWSDSCAASINVVAAVLVVVVAADDDDEPATGGN